jgi:hypothetical protein
MAFQPFLPFTSSTMFLNSAAQMSQQKNILCPSISSQ